MAWGLEIPQEEQQPLQSSSVRHGQQPPLRSNGHEARLRQHKPPPGRVQAPGGKGAPCFHLLRHTGRVDGDWGKVGAKKELEKQAQLVSVIAPWEPERASGWFVLGAGGSAGAVQEHVQHRSDRIPFLSENAGAGSHQPAPRRCLGHLGWRRVSRRAGDSAATHKGPHPSKGKRQGNPGPAAAASARSCREVGPWR